MASLEQLLERKLVFYFLKANNEKVYIDGKPGVGDGQGGLACCDSWGCKESDTTERLN